MTEQRELKFQDHIVKSYENQGGHARKWAAKFTAGNPDLICAMPGFGVHLIEVKHRPDWDRSSVRPNPLTELQRNAARCYINGGGNVYGAVIVGGKMAMGSSLALFWPTDERWHLATADWVGYVPSKGYDMKFLLENWVPF